MSDKPGTFKKGDARINRKGRPRNFDALRELALQIAHEKTPIIVDGHAVTVAEAILRQWAQSKNPLLQGRFIEVAYGKVPDKLDVNLEGEPLCIVIRGPNETSDV